jgi:hypothetical protein
MVSTAATFYKATLSVTTGLAAPYSNLATIYKQQVHSATDMASAGCVLIYFPAMFLCLKSQYNRHSTLQSWLNCVEYHVFAGVSDAFLY